MFPSPSSHSMARRSPRQPSGGFQSSLYKVSPPPPAASLSPSPSPRSAHFPHRQQQQSSPVFLSSASMKRKTSDPSPLSPTSTSFFTSGRSQKRTARRAAFVSSIVALVYFIYCCFSPRSGPAIALAKYSPKVEAVWMNASPTGVDDVKRTARGVGSAHRSSRKPHSSKSSSPGNKGPVQLTTNQELAALVSYLSSTVDGALPVHADASAPLQAEWLLDFDLSTSSAETRASRLAAFEQETWYSSPVVIFTKSSSVWSDEVQNIMQAYKNMSPPPLWINVENRPDEAVLSGVLTRLTGQTLLPSVLVGGVAFGGYEELKNIHEARRLKPLLESVGVKFQVAKPKKKLKHAAFVNA